MWDKINIDDFKNRDVKTFKRVFDDMFHHIRRFAEKIVKDPDDARDVASDTFAKCWELAANFESFNAVRSFLYITARNKCINQINKQKAENNYRNHLAHLSEQAIQEAVERIGLESFTLEELYNQVVKEVETLPRQTRLVFKMVFFEKRSRHEVADSLQISLSTVNNHVSTAMKRLRFTFIEKDMAIICVLLLGYSQN